MKLIHSHLSPGDPPMPTAAMRDLRPQGAQPEAMMG